MYYTRSVVRKSKQTGNLVRKKDDSFFCPVHVPASHVQCLCTEAGKSDCDAFYVFYTLLGEFHAACIELEGIIGSYSVSYDFRMNE